VQLTYDVASEAHTAALGAALAGVLPPGAVVALYGTLGAGKTRLVQAIAEGVGIDRRQVTSPTFVLIQEYQGRLPVYHFDAYRVSGEAEFLDLGPEEYFERGGLVLIEWADRVQGCLPPDRIDIRIEVIGDRARRVQISSVGHRCAAVLDRLLESRLEFRL